jgi:tRNA(Leu) C34 or U34 (ribose-2'-O)-methylase TrmL
MKNILKEKAINFREKGLSYSEILREVPVAKSTLALWLQSVGLSKMQQQRLTLKKIISGKRGAAKRKSQRIEKESEIKSFAHKQIGTISPRELWIIGTMLYWAEGSKQKEYNPSQKLVFSNSDPNMIRLYLSWLEKSIKIPRNQIELVIHIHETYRDKLKPVIKYWSGKTGFHKAKFGKIYFKKNILNPKRRNIGYGYYGLLRVEVVKSTDLNRKVTGWIEGIYSAESSNGRTMDFDSIYLGSNPGSAAQRTASLPFKLGAKDLRHTPPTPETIKTIKRNPIYLVLDNVIDTYNIGSLFRLSDAIAVEKMFICGETEYPPNSRIHKAAVGTEEWVPWEKSSSTVRTIELLKKEGVQIIAVEQSPKAISSSLLPMRLQFPCAIVIGNETTGISQEVLDKADIIVELPMFGVNKSLNVWGSAAVIAYKVIESLILKPYMPKKKLHSNKFAKLDKLS